MPVRKQIDASSNKGDGAVLGAPEGDVTDAPAPSWALIRGSMVVSRSTSPEGRSVQTVLITALRSGQSAACDRTLTPPENVPETAPDGTLTPPPPPPPPPPVPPGAVSGAISGAVSGAISGAVSGTISGGVSQRR